MARINHMKKMSCWSMPIALLALAFGTMADLNVTATVPTDMTVAKNELGSESMILRDRDGVQIAQGVRGQCRAATQSVFVYRERSTASPLRVLEPDERVTLAEESGRNGWIAIESPIRGFVEARNLKSCNAETSVSPTPPPNRPTPNPPSNLCRQVTYLGEEGIAIRESPNPDARRVGGVFFGERVTLSTRPTRQRFVKDEQGREWVRVTRPAAGWMSNGFPASGNMNLAACS
jgi:hypothetical protein